MKVVVTGATGAVGREVIRSLYQSPENINIKAASRQPDKLRLLFSAEHPETAAFDFRDKTTFEQITGGTDVLFLMCPSALHNAKTHFAALIEACRTNGVKHIVFLSAQGVEDNIFTNHYKIEKLIRNSGISYTFLRPGYFMQNFTGELLPEINGKHKIYLPSGPTSFSLIDVRDVASVATEVISHYNAHHNQSYDLTNSEKLNFAQMTRKISEITGKEVKFVSTGPLRYVTRKLLEGRSLNTIINSMQLHYLPRFREDSNISSWTKKLSGKIPNTFDGFIRENQHLFVEPGQNESVLKLELAPATGFRQISLIENPPEIETGTA